MWPGGACADSSFTFLLGKDWDFSSSGVFSGLEIDPDTLVQRLDLDSRSTVSSRTGLLLYCGEWVSAASGCEQRHRGPCVRCLLEQAQESGAQTQLPVFLQGLGEVVYAWGWRRQNSFGGLGAPSVGNWLQAAWQLLRPGAPTSGMSSCDLGDRAWAVTRALGFLCGRSCLTSRCHPHPSSWSAGCLWCPCRASPRAA